MLATGEGESYVIFIYGTIGWTTADGRSGGRNGRPARTPNYPARVGYSNAGQGEGSNEIRPSGNSPALMRLPSGNTGGARRRGVYVFRVDLASEMNNNGLAFNLGESQHHIASYNH